MKKSRANREGSTRHFAPVSSTADSIISCQSTLRLANCLFAIDEKVALPVKPKTCVLKVFLVYGEHAMCDVESVVLQISQRIRICKLFANKHEFENLIDKLWSKPI